MKKFKKNSAKKKKNGKFKTSFEIPATHLLFISHWAFTTNHNFAASVIFQLLCGQASRTEYSSNEVKLLCTQNNAVNINANTTN